MPLIVLLATLSARRAVLPEDRVVRRSSLLRGGADAPAYDPLHVGVTPVTVPFAVAGETEWPSDAAPPGPTTMSRLRTRRTRRWRKRITSA